MDVTSLPTLLLPTAIQYACTGYT